MAESRCFQTQLNSIMEIMSTAVVRQICKIVDSDLTSLRLELERALHDNTTLAEKMRVLECEVESLRKTGTRKSCRSVCIQTSEDDLPLINGIFGKEWCSSLWNRRPRTKEVVEMEQDVSDEPENNEEEEEEEDENMHGFKEEVSEHEISVIHPTSKNRIKTLSVSLDHHDVLEDMPDDEANDDDIHFISAGLPEASDVSAMVPDSSSTAATKLIFMDGTVQHVIVSGGDDDDDDDDKEEETRIADERGQLEFVQHCMPIDFLEDKRQEGAAFERPHEIEQDILNDSEYMSGSGEGGGGCAGDGQIFNYFDRFNIHHQPSPDNDSSKMDFTCTQCGKTFLRRNGLTLHMKSHQKHNAHECRTCNVIFPQKNLLRTHKCLPPEKLLAKTADMRIRCEMCGKYFHSKANLKVHYVVHTGERPHTCSFCGRGFSQKGNLTTHERIHKGERPYMCTVCGKSFTQKGNLTHHLAVHSKINGRMRNSVGIWQ